MKIRTLGVGNIANPCVFVSTRGKGEGVAVVENSDSPLPTKFSETDLFEYFRVGPRVRAINVRLHDTACRTRTGALRVAQTFSGAIFVERTAQKLYGLRGLYEENMCYARGDRGPHARTA